MKCMFLFARLAFVAMFFSACTVYDTFEPELVSGKMKNCPDSFTDSRDNNVYNVVKIANLESNVQRCWFKENLNYELKGSLCYDGDPANCKRNGRLYFGDKLKGVCPEGTHVSSGEDWKMLADVAGAKSGNIGGLTDMGWFLKSTSGWNYDANVSKAKDAWNFSALPSGQYDDDYSGLGEQAFFWTLDAEIVGKVRLDYDSDDASVFAEADDVGVFAYSIRCVLD